MIFRDDDKFRAIVEEYAQDNDLFLEDFRTAWIKLVNADRFGDVCVMAEDDKTDSTTQSPSMNTDMKMPDQEVEMPQPVAVHCGEDDSDYSTMVWVLLVVLVVIIFAQFGFLYATNTSNKISNKQTKTLEMPELGGGMFDVESK